MIILVRANAPLSASAALCLGGTALSLKIKHLRRKGSLVLDSTSVAIGCDGNEHVLVGYTRCADHMWFSVKC